MNQVFDGPFRKARACGAGTCVEVAILKDQVLLRDGKSPGPATTLAFTPAEWRTFVNATKNGEFDPL